MAARWRSGRTGACGHGCWGPLAAGGGNGGELGLWHVYARPGKAGDKIFKVLTGTLVDLLHTSPRRVFALARLAVKESIRKQAVVGLAVFVVVLLRLAWFVDPGRTDPTRSTWTNCSGGRLCWCWRCRCCSARSVCQPIFKNKTIFTIVTKPVRSSEIVLGRILGFVATGTFLLAVMGLMSFWFVTRMLDHTHDLTNDDLSTAAAKEGAESEKQVRGRAGFTDMARGHMHEVDLDDEGNGVTKKRRATSIE